MVIDFNIKGIIVPPSNINGELVERVSTYTYLGVKIASRIIGVDQVSVAQSHNDLSLKKIDQILNDSTHPLDLTFIRSSRSESCRVKLGPQDTSLLCLQQLDCTTLD